MNDMILSIWRSCLVIGLVGCVITGAAPVNAGTGTKRADDGARDLLLMCQGRYEDPELGLAMCTAYLKGYLDRASFTNVEGGTVEFCSATGKITPKSAAMALTRLAFSDPNAIDEPMPVFMSLALQRAFPCTEEMAAKLREEPEPEPEPPPPPPAPRGPAGAVGDAKSPRPAAASELPEKLTGPVKDSEIPAEENKPEIAYTGPKAGPAGDLSPASAPKPLDDHQAPAAAPGTQKAAKKATEIVIRPAQQPGQPLQLASPFQDAAGKQPRNPVTIPHAMSGATDAATPRIKPPTTMSNATAAPTNSQKASPEPPKTKPYGMVKPDLSEQN